MATQEPTINANVRLTIELANALDKHCADETTATGNPVTRADVVRLALAQYLGIARRNGDDPQPTVAPHTP